MPPAVRALEVTLAPKHGEGAVSQRSPTFLACLQAVIWPRASEQPANETRADTLHPTAGAVRPRARGWNQRKMHRF